MIDNNRLSQLAACLIVTNRHEEIEGLVNRHLVDAANGSDLHYYVGLAHAKAGRIDTALDVLSSVINKNPEHGPTKSLAFKLLVHKAKIKLKEKDWNGLSKILGTALDLAPETQYARNELSSFRTVLPLSYLKESKREEAAQLLEEEFKKKPADSKIIHNLALLYYWWALNEESRACVLQGESNNFQKVTSQESENTPFCKFTATKSRLWEKAIIYWTMLNQTDEFWTSWRSERQDTCGLTIKEEDLREMRNNLLEERLSRTFYDYANQYAKNAQGQDSSRHETYITDLILEKKSAKYWKEALSTWKSTFEIPVHNGIKRYQLIRALQEAEGFTPCYGTKKECSTAGKCLWGDSCISDKNRELLVDIIGGCLCFREIGTIKEAYKIVEILHNKYPNIENIAKLRIYFHPSGLGKIYILSEERKKHTQALAAWENMLEESVKDSMEGKYVFDCAILERGKESRENGDCDSALSDWSNALNGIQKTMKIMESTKDLSFKMLFSVLKDQVEECIVKTCESESVKHKQNNKLEDAIKILERGLKLVKNNSMREHLVIFYCDKGQLKIKDRLFNDARTEFGKALKLDPNYRPAKQGMGTSYNNEAVNKQSPHDAMPLYRKALEFEQDDQVIKINLAQSLNLIAVERLNLLNQYSHHYDCDEPIRQLEEAIRIYNPSIERKTLDVLASAEDFMITTMLKDITDESYKVILKNYNGARRMKNQLLRRY